ncbi:DEAD/DEAH box helicase family protein [Desulfobacter latus]|uniref:Type I restriction endonuclease subunit R n=1 Tax=Desulfobacter latus TaxID=2292 RepID=A0A850T571_9BACT|nr:DEAD/DEAH box helicase family protein [Desulfobacter latus]NWH04035.1 type I restriction endonuclease subunit R [Desulfobacter latus]
MPDGPEKQFQHHITDFLEKVHRYIPLQSSDITDSDRYFVEDHLISFIRATQKETFNKLAENYGSDAGDEIFRALKKELTHRPLWTVIRQGLMVRGLTFNLYFPEPRSSQGAAERFYRENRISFREELVIKKGKRPDIVLFLNGLPVIVLELKHEKNQTVHDAVDQYAKRDHGDWIFRLPFLYIAADTSDVMVATDPSKAENFRWHNSGLENKAMTDGEYPVEFLYRDVLSKGSIIRALSFYLVYVPAREAENDRPALPAGTIFPRFHQSRMVENLYRDLETRYAENRTLGKKYLIHHSAGSGKTLSICWLADRIHSLYKPGSNEKIIDRIFILTDRKALDKNIREDMEKLVHLADVVDFAKNSDQLARLIRSGTARIIVSTQQKFKYILEKLAGDQALRQLKVAFLIDEAHRSQEGKTAAGVKVSFREPEVEDVESDGMDPEEEIAGIIRAHDRNQVFVAFTATPSKATLSLFGTPFDEYTEEEAIREGYILDVASNIISYRTLYNLHCPVLSKEDQEKVYPAGVVAKALKNVAYQDDGLIQYKAEVMLRIFDDQILPLIGGNAKAMIVATSRPAGLRYFEILTEKLLERKSPYKVLFAFSPFVHPETNKALSETGVNGLNPGEAIEDRFEGDNYRLMVVANKFQEGFDQPLLAGMFLDKAVVDRNAVQTVSRLNRCHGGKDKVVVVDFTNNAKKILKAFKKYRKGSPFEPEEPDAKDCTAQYDEIISKGVFDQAHADHFSELSAQGSDALIQSFAAELRGVFELRIPDPDERKSFVYLLARFVKSYYFLSGFFQYPDDVRRFAEFAEVIGPQLIKKGSESDLIKLMRKTRVVKANVTYVGTVKSSGPVKLKAGGGKGPGVPIKKVTVQDAIDAITEKFRISNEEALIIREVTEEKMKDETILNTIRIHKEDVVYIKDTYRETIDRRIKEAYEKKNRFEALWDPKYIDDGAIFDIMTFTVIESGLQAVIAE